MADFNGAKPVMTVRDDEFKVKIVDRASGDSATKVLSIVQVGDAYSAGVNDISVPILVKDSSGNAIIPSLGAGGGLKTELIDAEGDQLLISDDGEALVRIHKAQAADGAAAPDEVVQVGGEDSAGNLQAISVGTDGSVNVNMAPRSGKVIKYNSSLAVGVGTETLHLYVVTNAKTFHGLKCLVGCRGAAKVRVGVSADGITMGTVYFSYYQDPKENYDHDIECLTAVGDGTLAICVGITNLDQATNEIYSTLQGVEV